MSPAARYALAALLGGSGAALFADTPVVAVSLVIVAAALIILPELWGNVRVRRRLEQFVWKVPRPVRSVLERRWGREPQLMASRGGNINLWACPYCSEMVSNSETCSKCGATLVGRRAKARNAQDTREP